MSDVPKKHLALAYCMSCKDRLRMIVTHAHRAMDEACKEVAQPKVTDKHPNFNKISCSDCQKREFCETIGRIKEAFKLSFEANMMDEPFSCVDFGVRPIDAEGQAGAAAQAEVNGGPQPDADDLEAVEDAVSDFDNMDEQLKKKWFRIMAQQMIKLQVLEAKHEALKDAHKKKMDSLLTYLEQCIEAHEGC